MPTIKVNKGLLKRVIDKAIPDETFNEKLPYLGTTLEQDIKGEEEFELETYVNRPDFLSEGGLGRALQGFLDVKKGFVEYKTNPSDYKVIVNPGVEKIRPYAAFAILKNVELNDKYIKSLMQLQEKLDTTHCRRRSLAGMGVYDLDEIKFPVNYTTLSWNMKFTPLLYDNEMTIREIFAEHPKGKEFGDILGQPNRVPAYVDASDRIMCAVPVTQAQFGKVTSKTKNILIEVTGRDWKVVNEILNILTTNMHDELNGKIYEVTVEYPYETPAGKKLVFPKLGPRRKIEFNTEYCNKLLGTEFSDNEIKDYLERMRFGIENKENKILKVAIPCYRTDILHPFDLVEEVAIAYGYNNFEPGIPQISTIGEECEITKFERKIAELCSGMKMLECQTYHLSNEIDLVEKMNLKNVKLLKTTNAVNQNYNVLRNSMLAMLIKTLGENTHYEYPQNLFETGEVYETPEEKMQTGMALCGPDVSYTKIRSYVEALMQGLDIEYEIKSAEDPKFIPGRAAALIVNKKQIGIFGEIHPQILENFGIQMPTAGAEIDLEELIK